MKKYIVFASVLVLGIAALVISQGAGGIRETLTGYQEVPALSTPGNGHFSAQISKDDSSFEYSLSYADTETTVTQAHIHLGQLSVNGGISVWLCGNPNPPTIVPPAGTQECPPAPATITGTIIPANVVGPAGQGIAAGEFAELLQAIRAGSTYANVHTTGRPGGEIRSQIDVNEGRHH